ncbi:hypothetical protein JZ751_005783, partial [Albula glossodonta]
MLRTLFLRTGFKWKACSKDPHQVISLIKRFFFFFRFVFLKTKTVLSKQYFTSLKQGTVCRVLCETFPAPSHPVRHFMVTGIQWKVVSENMLNCDVVKTLKQKYASCLLFFFFFFFTANEETIL